METALVVLIGFSIYALGVKKNLFILQIPRPYGPDYWYEKLGGALLWIAKGPFATLDSAINKGYWIAQSIKDT
jgi:hypothetical protein